MTTTSSSAIDNDQVTVPADAHSLSIDQVLNSLSTDQHGLNAEQVNQRQKHFGFNSLPKPSTIKIIDIFFRQFLNPLVSKKYPGKSVLLLTHLQWSSCRLHDRTCSNYNHLSLSY